MNCRLGFPRTTNCTIGELHLKFFMGKSMKSTLISAHLGAGPAPKQATCILNIAQRNTTRNKFEILILFKIYIYMTTKLALLLTITHKISSPTNTNILAKFLLDNINKDHDKLYLQGLIICYLLSVRHSLVIQEGINNS